MFSFFKKNTPERPQDVKTVREALLLFIRQELQKMEGGEGRHIRGLELYIACPPEERFLYDSAVFFEDEERFKNEVQRIADDFAIDLPSKWLLEIHFTEELPEGSAKTERMDVALVVKVPEHVVVQRSDTAYIRVINGEAEQEVYSIHAGEGRINIGRGRETRDNEGFVRENTIAFPDPSSNAGNKYISRQHAHIEWNKNDYVFMLFADEGGIPPRNKVKVKPADGHNTVKLTFTEFGHVLQEGDQIVLGESAILEFSYQMS